MPQSNINTWSLNHHTSTWSSWSRGLNPIRGAATSSHRQPSMGMTAFSERIVTTTFSNDSLWRAHALRSCRTTLTLQQKKHALLARLHCRRDSITESSFADLFLWKDGYMKTVIDLFWGIFFIIASLFLSIGLLSWQSSC